MRHLLVNIIYLFLFNKIDKGPFDHQHMSINYVQIDNYSFYSKIVTSECFSKLQLHVSREVSHC